MIWIALAIVLMPVIWHLSETLATMVKIKLYPPPPMVFPPPEPPSTSLDDMFARAEGMIEQIKEIDRERKKRDDPPWRQDDGEP